MPPIIIATVPLTVNTNPGVCFATNVSLVPPSVFDNCTGITLTNNAPSSYPVGVTLVEWLALDHNGNATFANQSVTVVDNQLPSISCSSNISHLGVAYITVPTPLTHDNCGVATLVNNFNGSSNASGIYPAGITTVVWTATDVHGNTNTCSMTVTINCQITAVNDTVTIPMNVPTTITVLVNDSACGAPVSCNNISVVIQPNHMSVQIDPVTGLITCNPVPGYVGVDSLKYRVSCTAPSNGGNTDDIVMTAVAWAFIHVLPPPTACVSGNATICPGGNATILLLLTGTPPFNVVLSNGSSNFTYNGINSTIYPINVTPTATTTYSIISVSDASTLTSTSNCTVTVTVMNIQAYVVTGGGNFCPGSAGSVIGLAGSEQGVIYKLYRDNQPVGIQLTGNGSMLNFGAQTLPGVYTVVATTGNCSKTMNGAAILSLYPLPTQYIVTGGGVCCYGCNVLHAYLSGSQQGVHYQLWKNGTILISQVWGTGNMIDFGYMTSTGTYTVTAVSSYGCTLSMYGEASVVLYPKPAAALVTPDTTICQGSVATLTINLTSGTPPWSVEVFDGTTTTTYGSIFTSPLIVNVIPTQTATYTIPLVTDAHNCIEIGTGSTTVNVSICENVFGRLIYNNSLQTALPEVTINLTQNDSIIQSTLTDINGGYSFAGVPNGTYQVVPDIQIPWGGSNSTDALMIMKFFTGMISLDPLAQEAGRINDEGVINSIDAMIVMKRFTQSMSSYPVGNWAFIKPEVVISNDLHLVDIEVLCKGDINSSYIPFVGKTPPPVAIEENGIQYVDQYSDVIIPVKIRQNMEVGAISLVVDYPASLIEILEIIPNDRAGGKMVYNVVNDELRVAWYQTMGTNFTLDETVFFIKARINNIDALDQIKFEALAGCEIADSYGAVSFVELSTPKLIAADNSVSVVIQPNPFTDKTSFVINTNEESAIEIWIYDMLGQKVQQLKSPDVLPAGTHTIEFDATHLTQGLYQYRMYVKGRNSVSTKTGMLIMEK